MLNVKTIFDVWSLKNFVEQKIISATLSIYYIGEDFLWKFQMERVVCKYFQGYAFDYACFYKLINLAFMTLELQQNNKWAL